MKESVHNVSTEKIHVIFKAVYSRATSSLISPFFLLSAACTGIEEHDCYISIRFGAISHMKESLGYLIGWEKNY